MPFSSNDVNTHNNKISSESAKRRWAAIANSVLKSSGDEGQAIRIANSRSKPSPNKEAIKRRLQKK